MYFSLSMMALLLSDTVALYTAPQLFRQPVPGAGNRRAYGEAADRQAAQRNSPARANLPGNAAGNPQLRRRPESLFPKIVEQNHLGKTDFNLEPTGKNINRKEHDMPVNHPFTHRHIRKSGKFTLIELLVVKTCQIYHSFLVCTGQSREGFGGEKAAMAAASLPVPNNHQTFHRPVIAPQQSLRSASGEVEQKREWVFPQKSGKSRSRFCGSFRVGRPQPSP